MSVYRTMSPREEADWLRAVEDGSLWPHHQESEASEQMWLWRQSGHLLKEIGFVTGLTEASVWARVRAFEDRRKPAEATA